MADIIWTIAIVCLALASMASAVVLYGCLVIAARGKRQ